MSSAFLPYDWQTLKDDDDNLLIYCWALDQNSNSSLIKITNFKPFVHLELPHLMTDPEIETLMSYFQKRQKNQAPTAFSITDKINLYYYKKEKKNRYLKLYFKNTDDIYYLKNTLRKKNPAKKEKENETESEKDKRKNLPDYIPVPISVPGLGTLFFSMWEDDISPVRKFLSIIDAEFAQWFRIEKEIPTPESEKISSCKNEYTINFTNYKPINNSISQSWRTEPTMLAIDIETYSPNHKAMPDPYFSEHAVYMISCIFYKLYHPESVKRYALIFGDCNEIPNSEIIKCDSEVSLIKNLQDLILKTDPDIVTGYNHIYYDYMYLEVRLKKELEEWGVCGRLLGVNSIMKKKTLISNAFGNNKMYILDMSGRINIDIYPLIKQGSEKLDMYKLDFVANHYLNKQKHDVKPEEMFKIYELGKNAITEEEKDYARLQMTRVMEYCIQDSVLVIELFQKLDLWIDLIQRSCILGVPVMDIFTEGQQVKCVSQIYHECFKNNIVMDHQEKQKFSYEGGFVGEPVPGLHENIICLDFASMYPSIMQADNISYETLVAPEYEGLVPDSECNCYSIESKDLFEDGADKTDRNEEDSDSDEENVKVVKKEILKKKVYKFKFVKREVKEGIIPKIVRKLVGERKEVKKIMESCKDPFTLNMLEKRQLALKVAGNSVYGFLAAYKLPLIQGAMAITWTGRNQIGKVNKYLLENFPDARIIYNDTDSVMVDMKIVNSKECLVMGEKLAKDITALFPPPVKIEFEKAMRILNLRKKKYAYLKIDKNGDYQKKINKKGIVTARRDNCKWMRDIYDESLEMILSLNPLDKTLEKIFSRIEDLFMGNVNPKDMSIIRELGSNYKSENAFMKVFSDELRKKGTNVKPGDRLQYLLLDNKEEHVGKKMILLENYENEKIDNLYYLEKLLKNPVEQLLNIAYDKEFKDMNHIFYKPKGRKHEIPINFFIRIICQMFQDNEKEEKRVSIKEISIKEILERIRNASLMPRIKLVKRNVIL